MTAMDLTEFITARLDEDEAAAKAAAVDGEIEVFSDRDAEQAAHILRHSPARVLREVAAKRAILARYAECIDILEDSDPDLYAEESGLISEYEKSVLPGLAAVYSDHPDYRAEWHA